MNKYGLGLNSTYYAFNYVDSFSIDDSSSITEFPIASRARVLDHKFNEPKSIKISGSVSNLVDNNVYPSINLNDKIIINNNLLTSGEKFTTKFYQMLETIMEESLVLSIFSPSLDIKNCLLTSFSWSDDGEGATFSLDFREIKTYFFQNITVKQVEPDPNLPDLNDPITQSAVESLLLKDSSETDLLIFQALRNSDLIDPNFGRQAATVAGILAASAAVTAAFTVKAIIIAKAGVAVASKIAIAGVSTLIAAATNPIGWIIIAVVIVAVIVVAVVYFFVKWIKFLQKRRMYIEEFRAYKDSKTMVKEGLRYAGVVQKIYDEIKKLDRVIKSYKINTNVSQELLFILGDDNFILELLQDGQGSATWHYIIKKADGEVVQPRKVLSTFLSFYTCDNNNFVFRHRGDKLYFTYDLQTIAEEMEASKSKDVPKNRTSNIDLRKVNIVTTSFDLEKLKDTISKITLETMRRK